MKQGAIKKKTCKTRPTLAQQIFSDARRRHLHSEQHKQKKRAAKITAGAFREMYLCEECGKVVAKIKLHHVGLIPILEDDFSNATISLRELFYGRLIAICAKCHTEIHARLNEEANKKI